MGYAMGSLVLIVLLLVVLAAWYKKEGNVQVERITTPGAIRGSTDRVFMASKAVAAARPARSAESRTVGRRGRSGHTGCG